MSNPFRRGDSLIDAVKNVDAAPLKSNEEKRHEISEIAVMNTGAITHMLRSKAHGSTYAPKAKKKTPEEKEAAAKAKQDHKVKQAFDALKPQEATPARKVQVVQRLGLFDRKLKPREDDFRHISAKKAKPDLQFEESQIDEAGIKPTTKALKRYSKNFTFQDYEASKWGGHPSTRDQPSGTGSKFAGKFKLQPGENDAQRRKRLEKTHPNFVRLLRTSAAVKRLVGRGEKMHEAYTPTVMAGHGASMTYKLAADRKRRHEEDKRREEQLKKKKPLDEKFGDKRRGIIAKLVNPKAGLGNFPKGDKAAFLSQRLAMKSLGTNIGVIKGIRNAKAAGKIPNPETVSRLRNQAKVQLRMSQRLDKRSDK